MRLADGMELTIQESEGETSQHSQQRPLKPYLCPPMVKYPLTRKNSSPILQPLESKALSN